jgi:hypothetical protein
MLGVLRVVVRSVILSVALSVALGSCCPDVEGNVYSCTCSKRCQGADSSFSDAVCAKSGSAAQGAAESACASSCAPEATCNCTCGGAGDVCTIQDVECR